MANEVADILRDALAAFGPNGKNWAQGAKAMFNPHCCVTLAFRHIFRPDYELVVKAKDVLFTTMGFKTSLPWREAEAWNDAPERTWPDVEAAFKQAIANAESTNA